MGIFVNTNKPEMIDSDDFLFNMIFESITDIVSTGISHDDQDEKHDSKSSTDDKNKKNAFFKKIKDAIIAFFNYIKSILKNILNYLLSFIGTGVNFANKVKEDIMKKDGSLFNHEIEDSDRFAEGDLKTSKLISITDDIIDNIIDDFDRLKPVELHTRDANFYLNKYHLKRYDFDTGDIGANYFNPPDFPYPDFPDHRRTFSTSDKEKIFNFINKFNTKINFLKGETNQAAKYENEVTKLINKESEETGQSIINLMVNLIKHFVSNKIQVIAAMIKINSAHFKQCIKVLRSFLVYIPK